jgi:hypothetical protein
MSRDEIKNAALQILGEISPEADPAQIRPDVRNSRRWMAASSISPRAINVEQKQMG